MLLKKNVRKKKTKTLSYCFTRCLIHFSNTVLVLTAAKKQSGSVIPEVLGLEQSVYSIDEILSEESAIEVFVTYLFLKNKKRITIINLITLVPMLS